MTDLEQVRFEAFRQSLARLRLRDDDLAGHLNDFYLQRRFADVMLYDDVLPVLAELRRNHHVGLLSNGNSYPKRLGLEDCFQAAVLSQDHGVEKPDRRIFDIASELLPGEPRIMVGDSLANDVAGAQAAGWTGVWLNREGAPTPGSRPRPYDSNPARTSPHGEGIVTLVSRWDILHRDTVESALCCPAMRELKLLSDRRRSFVGRRGCTSWRTLQDPYIWPECEP